ncbi:hypothetical protein NPIL_201641 [Nephila pilipes]|uniref:Uncharacterized protein n=1 Tax=Nephila pilipes TaxID=299642 RepID=A0A8X6KC30_NEPPI|nr:hypothetical protein NPIL_201641 [Nephila pilipes]
MKNDSTQRRFNNPPPLPNDFIFAFEERQKWDGDTGKQTSSRNRFVRNECIRTVWNGEMRMLNGSRKSAAEIRIIAIVIELISRYIRLYFAYR